jgi:hypothetical protein
MPQLSGMLELLEPMLLLRAVSDSGETLVSPNMIWSNPSAHRDEALQIRLLEVEHERGTSTSDAR